MKNKYPKYNLGDTLKLEEKLSSSNKKILNDFLKLCSIKAGEGKIQKIKRIMIQFNDVTGLDFDKQTKESVDSFLVILNQDKRSMWTKNEIKVYVRKFLKWFYKDFDMIENIKTDSRRDLDPIKINENNLVTKEDVEKMLRCAESFKEKAYLFLVFETGARPQELIELKWKDIKFEDTYADITLYSKKTNQSRTFPVHKSKEFLWEWKQNYSFPDVQSKDYVFPSRWREKFMTSAGLNKILRRMAEKSKLNKDVWSYLFRHSRATRLYEELPTPIVEQLMGHKNMHRIYAHISSKKSREEMLKKIYKIEELTPKEKIEVSKLKEQFKALEEQQKATEEILKKVLEKGIPTLQKIKAN